VTVRPGCYKPDCGMKPVRVPTLASDRVIAEFVEAHAEPTTQKALSVITWGADEHILIAAAAAFWILSRSASEGRRSAALHLLALSVLTSRLPKVFKGCFDQVRPDRSATIDRQRGIGVSGKAEDAFPSGHAVHMGALASAACKFPMPYKAAAITAAAGLSLSRIAILAHWTSDVVLGFAGGVLTERLLRRWTGYPNGQLKSAGSYDRPLRRVIRRHDR
jgi:membrane-associated phospholipid phosphatase